MTVRFAPLWVALVILIAFLGCASSSSKASKPKPTPVAKPTRPEPVTPKPDFNIEPLVPRPVRTPAPVETMTPRPLPTPRPSATPRPAPTPTPRPTVKPAPVATTTPPQYIMKGETANSGVANTKLSFTLLRAYVTDTVVAAFRGASYTFRPKSGHKFVLIEYRFQNTSLEIQTTPDITTGSIITQPKGYVYKLWLPPSTQSELDLYRYYLSGVDDVQKYGNATGGNVKLVQEFGTPGRVIFEIPEDMTPWEASFPAIKSRLMLTDDIVPPVVPPSSSLPPLRRGETVRFVDKPGMAGISFTFRYWAKSDRVIVFSEGKHRAYSARPGMKFLVLTYKFQNNGATAQTTPGVGSGQVVTRPRGNAYKLWQVPTGADLAAYVSSEAMITDIQVMGDRDAGNVNLEAGQAVDGRIAFEVPADADPSDATLDFLPARLIFD
ncbi:MAG: hypothetical protein HYY29_05125 [Chloroflexi bacterium]|nr:hypothetical protein [Chloroflexota bacterium]